MKLSDTFQSQQVSLLTRLQDLGNQTGINPPLAVEVVPAVEPPLAVEVVPAVEPPPAVEVVPPAVEPPQRRKPNKIYACLECGKSFARRTLHVHGTTVVTLVERSVVEPAPPVVEAAQPDTVVPPPAVEQAPVVEAAQPDTVVPAPAVEPDPVRVYVQGPPPGASVDSPTKGAQKIADLTAGNVREESELGGYVLFVDVVCERNDLEGTGHKLLTDILAPLCDAVARENQVAHWGLVEFARGSAFLAAKLDAWIKHCNPQGVISTSSWSPEYRAVSEVLRRYAKIILRGVR